MGPSPRYEPRPESPLPDGGLADTNSNSAVPWHSTMMSQSPLLGAPFHGYPGTGYAFGIGDLDNTSLHALLSTIPGATTHTIPSGPLVDTRPNTASVPSLPMPDPRLGANGSHPPVAPPHSHASISYIHHPADEPGTIASPSSSDFHTHTPTPPPIFCKWEGCRHREPFRRKNDLWRHIQGTHVSPRDFRCTARGCRRRFNRSDNLREHIRRRHPAG